jgi:amidophosphoribosyltransferase
MACWPFAIPFGIRPLCYGEGEPAAKAATRSWWPASRWRWKAPATLTARRGARRGLFIDLHGQMHASSAPRRRRCNPCMFEYVYLARPDSVLDGISVYQARLNLGETLAQRVISTHAAQRDRRRDPDPGEQPPQRHATGAPIGKPYREGFVKNRYVGRTFIMPGQAVRKKSVRQKAQCHRHGIQGPQRAAGGRLHRARHHQQGDRADGPRGRRAQGLHGRRPRHRCASPTSTASTCRRARN